MDQHTDGYYYAYSDATNIVINATVVSAGKIFKCIFLQEELCKVAYKKDNLLQQTFISYSLY